MTIIQAHIIGASSYLPSPWIHRGRTFHTSLRAPINRGLPGLSVSRLPTTMELVTREEQKTCDINIRIPPPTSSKEYEDELVFKLHSIAEAVADRAEMHANIGNQRNNWNTLLLSSINSITLTASIMAGLSVTQIGESTPHHLAFKLSSILLFTAATGLSLVLNKIQPSQLAEEQRNATRLFRQLEKKIQSALAIRKPSSLDVEDAMERVLALDKAYPLTLLGSMVEKFPETVKPAVWWPKVRRQPQQQQKREMGGNAWNKEAEQVMLSVLQVVKEKDKAEYLRLGNVALTSNKILAVFGPLLTGVAAIGTGLIDPTAHASWPVLLGVVGGALATLVNTMEHGCQVGMVFELYRNCAGSYQLLEEEIESNLEEGHAQKRENGELFEMKVALELGRSLSELRSVGNDTTEFAGKLF